MGNVFEEITWHTTFFISYARKMEKSLENMSAVFMNLSKAFDAINFGFVLAKLTAYGFSKQALNFMCSYLKNKRQKVRINNICSTLKEVIVGVPQGSIDRPRLFNLFINDLFLFLCFNTF